MASTLIISIAIFGLLGLVFYLVGPVFLEWFHKRQSKKAEEAAGQLEDIFMSVNRKKMLLIYIAIPLIGAVAGWVIFENIAFSFLGAVAGFIIPSIVIKQLRSAHNHRFCEQMVDTLMVLSSSLKAGLSLLQAIEVLVEEMPAPSSQEFSLLLKEVKMGISLEKALERLKQRIPSEDLQLLITAIVVSKETGGNLTELLDRLAGTIRQKKKITSQISNLTATGRWQGIIMSILPVGFSAVVFKTNPQMMETMLSSSLGRCLLIYAVVSELIGIVLIRAVSRVEV